MYANRGNFEKRYVDCIQGNRPALAENYDFKRVSYERSKFSFRSPSLEAHLSGEGMLKGMLSPQGAIVGR